MAMIFEFNFPPTFVSHKAIKKIPVMINRLVHKQLFIHYLKTNFMARIKESMHGHFTGKVGKLIGGKWNGVDYVRSIGIRKNTEATPSQQNHRSKMALTVNFTRTIKQVVKVGFRSVAVKMSGYNAAVRYLLKNAITGESPNYRIDYSKVIISRGEGRGMVGASVTSPAAETITFNWNIKDVTGSVKPTDKAILVAYCEAFNVSAFTIQGPERSTGTGSLAMPEYSGQAVHTWLAFISADGKTVFDSSYTGMVKIT
jgi:hypothetical protein